MKTAVTALVTFVAALLIGCGAGHPNLMSISVSPSAASASVNENVVFTAKGNFSNNTSRNLTTADGLSWKTSNSAATIGNTGRATCNATGSVTVTATAPMNLQITVNNGISNTSTNVSGSGTLNCT
jgi:hypothetical protein